MPSFVYLTKVHLAMHLIVRELVSVRADMARVKSALRVSIKYGEVAELLKPENG